MEKIFQRFNLDLDELLNYQKEIQWHGIEKSDIPSLKKPQNFCEIYTGISHDAKYERKPGFVNHLIIPYPYTTNSEKFFISQKN